MGIEVKLAAYALVAGLLFFGGYKVSDWRWQARIAEGRNEAEQQVRADHTAAIKTEEQDNLMFANDLANIQSAARSSSEEIARADLKPKPVTIYVERQTPVVCPVATQFTPDFVRLYNGEDERGPDSAPAPGRGGDASVRERPH